MSNPDNHIQNIINVVIKHDASNWSIGWAKGTIMSNRHSYFPTDDSKWMAWEAVGFALWAEGYGIESINRELDELYLESA